MGFGDAGHPEVAQRRLGLGVCRAPRRLLPLVNTFTLLLAAEHDIQPAGRAGLMNLIYALRNTSTMDFVGGSILRTQDNTLRMPCLQQSRCQWTFWQQP